jgi:hypothetical protein
MPVIARLSAAWPATPDVLAADWPGTTARVVVLAAVLALVLGLATIALAVLSDRTPSRGVRARVEGSEGRELAAAGEGAAMAVAADPAASGGADRRVVDGLLRALDEDTRPPRKGDDTVSMAPTRPEASAESREAATGPTRAAIEPVRPREQAPAPRRPTGAACEIRWWRGYVYSRFYAFARDAEGQEHVIAESPDFRWRKSEPPPEEHRALAAHRALVGELERQGWGVVGHGEHWYALRLRPRRGRTRRPAADERE